MKCWWHWSTLTDKGLGALALCLNPERARVALEEEELLDMVVKIADAKKERSATNSIVIPY